MNSAYLIAANRTEAKSCPKTGILFSEGERKRHSRLGIITKLAELLDIEKKAVYYGKKFDIDHIKEELGDLCWYLALGFNICEMRIPDSVFVADNAESPARILELALHTTTDETLEFSDRVACVYLAARSFAYEMELDWDEVLRKNQVKLEARYKGRGFTAEEAIHRDTEQEKEAMNE